MTNQTSAPISPDAGTILVRAAERIETLNNTIAEFRSPAELCPPMYVVRISQELLPAITLAEVPPGLRPLHRTIVEFAIKWAGFLNGDGSSGGWPSLSVMAGVHGIVHALIESRKPRPGRRYLKPIKALREEFGGHGMTPVWIAREYGFLDSSGEEPTWKGCFFRNGNVDSRLIEEEEQNPGSVVKPGYHPDDFKPGAEVPAMAECEFATVHAIKLGASLGSESSAEDESVKRVPESVVLEMIREQMTVEQIARLSGFADHEVQEIAKNAGLQVLRRTEYLKPPVDAVKEEHDFAWSKAVELAGLKNEAAIANSNGSVAPTTAGDSADDPADDSEASPIPVAGVPNDVPTFPAASAVDDRVRDALRTMLEGNRELTTPVAIVELRAIHLTANALQIGRVLAELRKELAAPATVG